MIRLFSIEDHWMVTVGLRTKFNRSSGVVIACSATTLAAAVEGTREDSFDIILLDLFIPGTEPLENIKALRARYPGKPVVILTGEEQEIWKMQAAEAGVAAYLTKHATKEEMIETMERVFGGENILTGQMAVVAARQAMQADHQHLFRIKPSEKDILYQLARGDSQKQISANLHLSESAVEKTLRKLRRQFSVNNTLELVAKLEKFRFFSGSGQSEDGS